MGDRFSFKNKILRGAWVTQLVKHLTRDFGLGHDLRIVGSSPIFYSVLCGEFASRLPPLPLLLPLPLPLPLFPIPALVLSLKSINHSINVF